MIIYIVIGVLLFIAGLVLVTFIPFSKPIERIGTFLMVLGVVFAVFFPLIRNWWINSVTFQLIVYGSAIFIIILMILFSGNKSDNPLPKKK